MIRALTLALCLPAAALAAPEAILTGPDGLNVTLTAETLATLPVQEVDTTFTSSKGEVSGHYTGALLWDVIAANTGIEDDVKKALRQIVLVTAGDGHQVAFSIGELAPDFGNRPVMIGYSVDGATPEDGLRMVAPGDKRGARYIKDIVSLEIR